MSEQGNKRPAATGGRAVPAAAPDAQHILLNAERTSANRRTLKHGDLFAVLDRYGDIRSGQSGEEGLYFDGTRFLSGLTLELNGDRPVLLGSTVRDDNDQLTATLTNADLFVEGSLRLAGNSLHIARKAFLFEGVFYQKISLRSYADRTVDAVVTIRFGADFRDIYEVRGTSRRARGMDLPPGAGDSRIILRYDGLDGEMRSSAIDFEPAPGLINPWRAEYHLSIPAGQTRTILVRVACHRSRCARPAALTFEIARQRLSQQIERQRAGFARLHSSNGQCNAWVSRAAADLHMMVTDLPTGPYPYAGVPWFNTVFGRDGILTAWKCLWMWPELARGVLSCLASTQASAVIAAQDAEPGKILHETRAGEMARLGEIPFGCYYGSVDATPLFVALAGAYYQRTGDQEFIHTLWPNVEAALEWIGSYGDRDGDGFVEYQRRSAGGLIHQGWKDEDDAVFHRDGSFAEGPIALCEVQGYVYAAHLAAAALAEAVGRRELAAELAVRADRLRRRFDEAFWCEDLSTYALALDGEKRRCAVVGSNAGHCLFTGIATPERAARVVATLLARESYSGWGIRTVASSERRFNPMSYHNGCVWPHDNALIAGGMARYGFTAEANRIFRGLFDAATCFDLCRMPELFCGFDREPGEGPVLYPVACSPQAWSAASVFLLFQASLGLQVDGAGLRVTLRHPRLPEFLREVAIRDLRVGESRVDLEIRQAGDDLEVALTGSSRDAELVVER